MNPFLDRWMTHIEGRAEELAASGRHGEAAASRQEICRTLERHVEEDDPLLIEQMRRLAVSHRAAGDLAAAEDIYLRILRLIAGRHGYQHIEFAQSLNRLGVLYCEMERYRRAAAIYRRALTLTRQQVPADDPRLGAVHHNLASTYHALGWLKRARSHYLETLRILDQSGPSAEHAFCLCDLAEVLMQQFPNEADDYFQEGLSELRLVCVDGPPELAQGLIRFAYGYLRCGRNRPASVLLREAEALLANYGPHALKELELCRNLLRRVAAD